MLGAYHLPGLGKLQAGDDPRLGRLRAAWPAWEYRTHPKGGTLLLPKGDTNAVDLVAGVKCADGLIWHPPATTPTLHDLAREEIPQPSARITLRRVGPVSIPLGVGPVFGAGPKRGQPSSDFGRLAHDLFARARRPADEWTTTDDRDLERMLFLALQSAYHLTDELFGELAPYDLDEVDSLISAIWGRDPKASASDGATSPPSPQESSPNPG